MKTVVIRHRSRVCEGNTSKKRCSLQGFCLELLEEKGSRQRAGEEKHLQAGGNVLALPRTGHSPGLGFLTCTERGTVPASLPSKGLNAASVKRQH